MHAESGCARIHPGEPHVIRAWPRSSVLPKIFVARSHASSYASQCLCGLACEEPFGDEVMTKARI